MKQVDELIYDAICADQTIMQAIGGRIVSTCFEVSPDEKDNTPLPNIIVMDDGFQNLQSTKEDMWEADEDRVQCGVEVDAQSPQEVKRLIRLVRRAVQKAITAMVEDGEDIPVLDSLQSDGIAWDWLKPCYYQRITYQCTTETDIDNEQEE